MTAAEIPWDERPAARFDPDDPYACPWECDPPPWDDTPAPWRPGTRCALHGDAIRDTCPSCPPAGHPLYDLLRKERA